MIMSVAGKPVRSFLDFQYALHDLPESGEVEVRWLSSTRIVDSVVVDNRKRITLPPGCPFHPRCPYVMDRCRSEVPPLAAVGTSATHLSACWLPHDMPARNALRRKVVGESLPVRAEA